MYNLAFCNGKDNPYSTSIFWFKLLVEQFGRQVLKVNSLFNILQTGLFCLHKEIVELGSKRKNVTHHGFELSFISDFVHVSYTSFK